MLKESNLKVTIEFFLLCFSYNDIMNWTPLVKCYPRTKRFDSWAELYRYLMKLHLLFNRIRSSNDIIFTSWHLAKQMLKGLLNFRMCIISSLGPVILRARFMLHLIYLKTITCILVSELSEVGHPPLLSKCEWRLSKNSSFYLWISNKQKEI